MPDILSIRATAKRLRADQLPVSENALRHWVKDGDLPCRWIGSKALLFYPSVRKFLEGEASSKAQEIGEIRKISV